MRFFLGGGLQIFILARIPSNIMQSVILETFLHGCKIVLEKEGCNGFSFDIDTRLQVEYRPLWNIRKNFNTLQITLNRNITRES